MLVPLELCLKTYWTKKKSQRAARLDLALTAAWTIIDSKAMPILLEGILLLGAGAVSC